VSATVLRLDFGRLGGKAERTPQGGLRIPARLTRTGIFTYRRADGTVTRELRPADEVFRADSLATLRHAPVTDLHPPEGVVAPDNWRARAAGHVSEGVRQDGDFVTGDLIVQDAALMTAVERGERREISCGYRCRLDATPGTYQGQPYDIVQRDIQYNHAALLPRGAGRAGRDVSLRLDAGDAVQLNCPEPTGPEKHARNDSMKTIRIDGIDYPVEGPTLEQALSKALADRDARLDALTKELAAAKSAGDATQARLDSSEKELGEVKTKLAEAGDPKRLDAIAAERATLLANARRLGGDVLKLDGLGEREIMNAALSAIDPELKLDGKSDDYVRARFDAELARIGRGGHVVPGNTPSSVRTAAVPGGGGGEQPRLDAEAARIAAEQRSRELWKRPGDVTTRAKTA